jgi:hypothetical protein
LDKKVKGRWHVLTEEKLDNICARLEHLPRKSLEKLVRQADVSVSSARTATKLLKLHPVKMTHTYIPWIQKLVRLTVGCGISHKVQNIQMSTI